MPQKVQVENKASKYIPRSSFFLYIMLFETKLQQVPEAWNFSVSPKCEPGFIHLASRASVCDVMTIEDVLLMSHTNHNYDGGCEHCITSIATLLDQQGCSLKAYGWAETDTAITFVLNERDEQSPAQFLTFNCTHIKTEVVRN